MRKTVLAALLSLLLSVSAVAQVQAGGMEVSVDIPRIDVAEYHRPYVAMWLQNTTSGDITNLAVWYQIDHREGKGADWLKDMRQWWRRSGRSLTMPVDGVTGATRAPGEHSLSLESVARDLAPGNYELMVEAAREVGGRELLAIEFEWPVAAEQTLEKQGTSELGMLRLRLQP